LAVLILTTMCYIGTGLTTPICVVKWITESNSFYEWIGVICLFGYVFPFLIDFLIDKNSSDNSEGNSNAVNDGEQERLID